jgi:mono/diheme cytochrome c family protein
MASGLGIVLMKVAFIIAAGMTFGAFAADLGKIPPASTKTGLTYAKDIKPIFDKSCIKCHGEEKQKGKLRLDSLEAAIKGGKNGPNIIPNDGAKSGLVQAIARLDPDEAMPPDEKGEPLTAEQVGLVRAWIDQGAK